MKEIIGLVSLIAFLIIYDRWFRPDIEDWTDDRLRNSPLRPSITKMLQSMGAPKCQDPVEFLTSPRFRLWSRLPIWIMIAMLAIGLLMQLFKWVKS